MTFLRKDHFYSHLEQLTLTIDVSLNLKLLKFFEKMKKITSKTYTSSVHSVSNKEAIIFRKHRYEAEKVIIDVHSKVWTLAYAHIKTGNIFLSIDDEWIEIKGRVLFYIAPFSILKWKVKKGELKWVYFLSLDEVESAMQMPSKVIFEFDQKIIPLFKNSKAILDFVKKINGTDVQIDNKSDVVSGLKVKIESRFANAENVKDLLNKKQTYSYISRQFKKRYGLSPVDYRNQLRLMQSSYDLMFDEKSILETSLKNGISDSKFFYQKFNKILRTNPSSFIIKNKKIKDK